MSTRSTEPAAASAGAADDALLREALVMSDRPPRPSTLTMVRTFAWRGILKIKHVPEQLIDVTITPILFLVMFTYLFGGAISGSTGEYLQFILPGILVQSILFTTVYSGVSLNTDMTKGVVDRFRSLPIWEPSPLVGAVGGDAMRYVLAGAITVVVGLIMGYEAAGGVLGVIAGIALIAVFSFGLSWVFATVGLVMRSPNATLNTGFMALFPLVFLSNILVPPQTLPSGLRVFVEDINPISYVATATRALMSGEFDALATGVSLGFAAVLVAIFVPLTSRLYRRA
ncbi:ABC transporter permease [Thermoleophilia bacterium SCSIO 60948]|nr:ABC transporter permease [Thermoleophilia bacterium SCSIO 60948]